MKELVVVVHGVGVKEAGVCSDLLSANFKSGNYRPLSSDDFVIREDEDYSNNGKYQVFQSRVRRFEGINSTKKPTGKELIVADFYWGDLSRVGTGLFGLVYAFVTMILGLSHPLRENARYIYKDSDIKKLMVNVFVHLIHGPIAATNLILLGGMAIAWAMVLIFGEGMDTSAWTIFAFAAAGLASGFAIRILGKVAFLSRLLGTWMIVTTATVILFALVDTHFKGSALEVWFSFADDALSNFLCENAKANQLASVDQTCLNKIEGLYLFGARVLAFSAFAWSIALAIVAIPIVGSVINFLTGKRNSRSIIIETMSLMMLLWLLLVAASWGVLGKAGVVKDPLWVENALSILPLMVAIFVALLFTAMTMAIFKRSYVKQLTEDTMGENGPDMALITKSLQTIGNKYRVIINGWVLMVLRLGLMIALGLVCYAASPVILQWLGIKVPSNNIAIHLFEVMEDNVDFVLLFLAAVGAAATGVLSFAVKGGLEILKDIITYINNQKSFDFRLGDNGDDDGYFLRKRMQRRLRAMVEYFIELDNPDVIKFVTHSQGTVIAIDTLDFHGSEWRQVGRAKNRPRKIHLATMGSPYTHIYNYYFPDSFKTISERPNLQKRSDGGVLENWVNIFRTDDFVGTYVDPDRVWPQEHCVGINGHTNYWSDKQVGDILRQYNK